MEHLPQWPQPKDFEENIYPLDGERLSQYR